MIAFFDTHPSSRSETWASLRRAVVSSFRCYLLPFLDLPIGYYVSIGTFLWCWHCYTFCICSLRPFPYSRRQWFTKISRNMSDSEKELSSDEEDDDYVPSGEEAQEEVQFAYYWNCWSSHIKMWDATDSCFQSFHPCCRHRNLKILVNRRTMGRKMKMKVGRWENVKAPD